MIMEISSHYICDVNSVNHIELPKLEEILEVREIDNKIFVLALIRGWTIRKRYVFWATQTMTVFDDSEFEYIGTTDKGTHVLRWIKDD